MGYEIEFKLIDIKDINKIQCVEETEGPFGDDVKVVCRHDITDEYCKTIMQRAMTRIAIECEWRYIGCTERIGHLSYRHSPVYSIAASSPPGQEPLSLPAGFQYIYLLYSRTDTP